MPPSPPNSWSRFGLWSRRGGLDLQPWGGQLRLWDSTSFSHVGALLEPGPFGLWRIQPISSQFRQLRLQLVTDQFSENTRRVAVVGRLHVVEVNRQRFRYPRPNKPLRY